MHTRLIIGTVVFLVVLLLAFLYVEMRSNDYVQQTSVASTTTPSQVTLHDKVRKNIHTITGTIGTRNPCQSVDATSTVNTTVTPAVIRVDLTLPLDDGICLQLPATKDFAVTAAAPTDATVTVYVNNVPVTPAAS